MRRSSALDKIVSAFADSVVEGDFEGAEGWFTLARDHADRGAMREPRPDASARQDGLAGRS